ncbi:hypothetical protein IB246_13735 [Pseudomonas sp. PDM01]|nr:hypothetical protein [Pseudomonas sp. PDM01]
MLTGFNCPGCGGSTHDQK